MAKFDVLRPELLWIGDQCYRKFQPRQSTVDHTMDEKSNYSYVDQFDDDDDRDVIIAHEGNDFYATKQIPTLLYIEILTRIKKLGKNLKLHLTLPVVKTQDFVEISVTGKKDRDIAEAIRRIALIVEEARLAMRFSHFVSFPMNFPYIIDAFEKFKDEVLENCGNDPGVSPSIFQNPKKLHITVTILLLLNKMEREQAAAILQNCRDEISAILHGETLTVQVRGIEYMNDDPEEVHVLYAKVLERNNDCLQRISDLLLKEFKASKLCHEDRDCVKLHITLMNSSFREDEEEASASASASDGDRWKQKRKAFDARRILEKYKDFEFGAVSLSEIHISTRSAVRDDGYYLADSLLNI